MRGEDGVLWAACKCRIGFRHFALLNIQDVENIVERIHLRICNLIGRGRVAELLVRALVLVCLLEESQYFFQSSDEMGVRFILSGLVTRLLGKPLATSLSQGDSTA